MVSLPCVSGSDHSSGWFGRQAGSVLPILHNPICLSQQLPGEGILARGSSGKALLVVVLLTGQAGLF